MFGNIGSSRARPLRTLFRYTAPPPIPALNVHTTTAILCYSSGTTGTGDHMPATARPLWMLVSRIFGCGTGRPKGVELTHYNLVANLVQVGAFEKDLLVPSGVLHAVLPLYVPAGGGACAACANILALNRRTPLAHQVPLLRARRGAAHRPAHRHDHRHPVQV